jgi:hypothetical protein
MSVISLDTPLQKKVEGDEVKEEEEETRTLAFHAPSSVSFSRQIHAFQTERVGLFLFFPSLSLQIMQESALHPVTSPGGWGCLCRFGRALWLFETRHSLPPLHCTLPYLVAPDSTLRTSGRLGVTVRHGDTCRAGTRHSEPRAAAACTSSFFGGNFPPGLSVCPYQIWLEVIERCIETFFFVFKC